MVLVVSSGDPAVDQISFTYRKPVSKGEPQRDLASLARALGQPVPAARVTTESIRAAPGSPRMTSVETGFAGLVDRAQGQLRLDPFRDVFARFPHLRVSYFVTGAFQPKPPLAAAPRPGWRQTVNVQGQVITVDVWRDPSAVAGASASRRPGSLSGLAPGLWRLLPIALVIVAAGLAAAVVYALARGKN
jgi:hypothetical protein